MKKITIDRSKWRCGGAINIGSKRGLGFTLLKNSEGFMCCLGQRIIATNPELDSCMMGKNLPAHTVNARDTQKVDISEIKALLRDHYNGLFGDSEFTYSCIKVNDDANITDTERERRLIDLAKKVGEEWEFVGEYYTPQTERENNVSQD